MKKKNLLALIVLLVVVMSGCGGKAMSNKDKEVGTSKNKIAEISIENGTYVIPFTEDGEGGSDTYIALDVKVKNIGKEQQYLSTDSFALFEKGEDQKITPDVGYRTGIENFDGGKLSAGKNLNGTILFNIDSDKEYTLSYSPSSISEDSKNDIEVAIDLSKYEGTKKQLDEPKKALDAYIDVVLLNKENADYDKYVSTDSDVAKETVKKAFTKNFKNNTVYSYKPTDEELTTFFNKFQEIEAKRATYKTNVIGNVGKKALVEMTMKGLSNEAINEIFGEYKDEYIDQSDTYDSEKSEQYALTKYTEILEKSDLGEPRNDLKIVLTKKDDKWDVSLKSNMDGTNEYLLRAFIGGVE
ncbi:DUF5105 domain-containing protein [Carnobacterium gallinarum]|uniref:DUF5105 domain-containing protein n=1 Tax=Carnobacterium gallinarum TaxID=2749 RepID=UPI0005546965|nr:DUF5105 domain-containing protein [Carnobacterium gallinarum]